MTGRAVQLIMGERGQGKVERPFKEFSYAQCLSFLLATNADVAKSNV